jgi:hypothetical protein
MLLKTSITVNPFCCEFGRIKSLSDRLSETSRTVEAESMMNDLIVPSARWIFTTIGRQSRKASSSIIEGTNLRGPFKRSLRRFLIASCSNSECLCSGMGGFHIHVPGMQWIQSCLLSVVALGGEHQRT